MKKRVNLFFLMFLIASSTAWAGGCPMSGHSSAGQGASETTTAKQGEIMGVNCSMCPDSSSAKPEANVSKTDFEEPGQELDRAGHAH